MNTQKFALFFLVIVACSTPLLATPIVNRAPDVPSGNAIQVGIQLNEKSAPTYYYKDPYVEFDVMKFAIDKHREATNLCLLLKGMVGVFRVVFEGASREPLSAFALNVEQRVNLLKEYLMKDTQFSTDPMEKDFILNVVLTEEQKQVMVKNAERLYQHYQHVLPTLTSMYQASACGCGKTFIAPTDPTQDCTYSGQLTSFSTQSILAPMEAFLKAHPTTPPPSVPILPVPNPPVLPAPSSESTPIRFPDSDKVRFPDSDKVRFPDTPVSTTTTTSPVTSTTSSSPPCQGNQCAITTSPTTTTSTPSYGKPTTPTTSSGAGLQTTSDTSEEMSNETSGQQKQNTLQSIVLTASLLLAFIAML